MGDIYTGTVTEWLVTDTSTGDDDEVTVTKAAEEGKSHFITFICCSTDSTTAMTGGVVKADLYDHTTSILHFWPQDADGGSPWWISLVHPIKIKVGNKVELKSTMNVASDDQVSFTLGGFTR